MPTESDDIKPSNHALNQAASWLGVSDPQKLLDEDPAAFAFEARPEGLGLGAKFLPHHKAVHLTAPLERRFQKRLARDSTGTAEGSGSSSLAKKPRNSAQLSDKPNGTQHDDGSSDEDDKGRAGAFSSARGNTQQPHTFSKQQLLVPAKKRKQQQQTQQQSQKHQQAKQHRDRSE